ncbi:MAG TPA: DUF4340 domain-containing protein [Candidatus Agathobaculum stercoravium]|nr:DUF4340 domain-containing protein [uncultured Agathobaculum sp.]HIV98110.1 DUF4340 domain-containing protein [Candidatus Agathobaculum stercoravium]
MKRSKRLHILLGVLAAVGIVTFAVTQYEEKQEEIEASGEVVLEIDPAAVQTLSWEYDAETLAFHKDGTWVYDTDEAFPVDEERIDELLGVFEAFSAAFIIEDVTDYSQYGLDDPVCTIGISTGDTDYEIQLGDFSTMDSQRYVSIGDGNVYLATADPLDYFDAALRDMIDNDEAPDFGTVEAIRFDGDQTCQIAYQEYTEDSSYTYCSDDVYFIQQEDAMLPLDTSRVEGYLDSISGLSLTDYVTYNVTEEELAEYGLDAPELSVTVTYVPEDSEQTAEFTLHISRDPDEQAAAEAEDGEEDETEEEITAYARVGESQIVYQITGDSYEALMAAGYDDLRHYEVLTADFADVTGLDITLEGESYTITAEGSGEDKTFYYGEEELDIADLQSALEDMGAASFTDEEPSQKQEISITVHLDNEAHPTVQIDLYRYDGEQCLAVLDGTPTSLVPRDMVVDLIEAVNAIVL